MKKDTKKDASESKNTKKEAPQDMGYSIKLNAGENPKKHSEPDPKALQAAFAEKLKSNPEAMKALSALLQGKGMEQGPKTPVEKAKVLTVQNLKKSFAASLKWIDSAINYIVKKDGPHRNSLMQQARPPVLFGLSVAFVTFVIAGFWSGLAPLDSSSHAVGFVVPSSKKQIIQHKEGGIIEKIYVKEGELVKANQPLIKLSDITLKSQIKALKTQHESLQTRLALVKEQLKELNDLYEEGFATKNTLIQLQAQEADLISHLSENESRTITAEESFGRLVISAPVEGTVNQIQFYTIGAAIPPGATLMTVVPKDDNLLIEAYVKPDDIDSVHIGLKAKIRISAFKHRSVAPFQGVVTSISSDVVEPTQHHPSQASSILQQGLQYKVQISVDPKELTKISKYRNYELYPGMMADVMIVTGERTMLQYLLDPITSTFWHAFIEK